MRIAVIGAGGVGGVFGAALLRGGADVVFVARGAHLAALQRDGLRIESGAGEVRFAGPVSAAADPREVGPVDVIIFAVKLWDLAAAAAAARPLVGPSTFVVALQNGVEAADIVASALPGTTVLDGIAFVAARIDAPGIIRQTGTMATMTFGPRRGPITDPMRELERLARAGGMTGGTTERVEVLLWEKLVFLASISGVGAAARQPIGVIRARPETRALLRTAIAEVTAVGQAREVPLEADLVERTLATVDGLPAETRSSMHQDLEAGGRLELPWLSGAVVRLGREAGVPTPVHATLLGVLSPYVDGAAPS